MATQVSKLLDNFGVFAMVMECFTELKNKAL